MSPGTTPNWAKLLLRLFGETILEVVYGIAPKGPHDSFIKNAEDAVYAFSQAGEPGRWLVDAFPLRSSFLHNEPASTKM
jgi:hypothetical protein